MATNISPHPQTRYSCSLCDSVGVADNHKIMDCPKFSSPMSKLSKIKDLNGCTKCGLLNHSIKNCRYKFKYKCKYCSQWHAHFLCTKSENETNDHSRKSNKDSSKKNSLYKRESNCVNFDVMNSSTHSSNILIPTFTARLRKPGRRNKFVDARALYDPASQVSFVTERLLKDIEHKIIDKDVTIRITGFNESKLFVTKIVDCALKINNEWRNFHAVVVPEIKSKISVSDVLPIAREFVNESIPLADCHLTREGDAGIVSLLLGVDFAHILPVQSCTFGNDRKSLVYHTSLGIMLCGNLNVLNCNLSCLEAVKGFIKLVRNE